VDGVRHQVSTGASNLRQAKKVLQKLKEEANARRHQLIEVDPNMRFGGLAAEFVVRGFPKPYHFERLKPVLGYFAEVPVVRITQARANDYRKYRRSKHHVTDATVNRDLSVLRRVLNWGVEEALLVSNPLGRLRLTPERRIKRVVLSLEEEGKLLEAASEHLKRIIIAAVDTGMRRGEITGQLWEDVDLNRRLLSVTRSKTRGGEHREIPLTKRLLALLEESRQPRGVIFTYKGRPIHAIRRTWVSSLRRAKLRHIRFHDLRHTFNTRLMEAGVTQDIRMALMGHASGHRVHAIYTHVELPAKRQAIAQLEEWVRGQEQQKGGSHDE
jgi:integrase